MRGLFSILGVLFVGAIATASTVAFAKGSKFAIAGTSVSLVPLKDFVPATDFAGLMNPATKASVLVAELPAAAYDQIAPKFANLDDAKIVAAAKGIEVQSVEQLDIAGQKAPLIIGKQMAGGIRFDKWMIVLKGARTVLVTVQSPTEAKLDPAVVRAMLSSITLGNEPSLADRLRALPFAITVAEPFRIVDTIAGSGVTMTVGPLHVDPAGTQPMLIVVYQLSGPTLTAGQLEPTAETLLKGLPGFSSVTIVTRQKTRFIGGEGVMLAGSYVHDKGGERRFEQYMAVDKSGRYVHLFVYANADTFDGLKPAIKAIVDSVAVASGN